VIDSLVVTLGLDPSNFTKEQKKAFGEALKSAKDLEKEQKKLDEQRRKSAEEANKKIANSFNSAKNEVLAFAGAIIGAASIADFVKQTVALDANVGRLAHNLNISTEELSGWEGAVRQMGGTTQDADTSIQSLVSSMEQIKLTGQSPLIPYFQLLGISLKDLQNPTDTLLKLADRFHGMDPRQAAALGAGMGLSPAMVNLLEKGRDAVRQYLKAAEDAYPIHQKDAEAAEEAQRRVSLLADAYKRLGNDILTQALPPLTDLANGLATFGETDQSVKDLTKSLGDLAGAFGSVSKSFGGIGNLMHPQIEGMAKFAEALSHLIKSLGDLSHGDLKGAGAEAMAAGAAFQGVVLTPFGAFDLSGAGGAPKAGSGGGASAAATQSAGGSSEGGAARGANWAGASQAYNTLMGLGATQAGAIGGTAILGAESGWNTAAANGSSTATGIGQWLWARQKIFAQVMGKALRGSSLQDQLKFMSWELQNTPYGRKALSAIKSATSVRGAEDAWLRFFEGVGPNTQGLSGIGADYFSDMRRAHAFELRHGLPGASSKTNSLHIGAMHIHTKATDAKGIARDMHQALVVQAQRGLG
jgi:tail lysozyme